MNCRCISRSAAETVRIGNLLGRHLPEGSIVGLSGQLGAGKTELVRGIVEGAGIAGEVTSPTFVLETIYESAKESRIRKIHHWDLYRLGHGAEIREIEESAQEPGSIVVVEWPEKVPSIRDLLSISVQIDVPNGATENERELLFTSNAGDERLSDVKEELERHSTKR